MSANFITLCRLLLTFTIIALLGQYRTVDIACIAIIGLIFALDAVDGIVARKSNQTSAFGATFDTIADRIVENTFWMYFAVKGLIPFWFPIIVMSRGFLTDGMQRAFLTPGNQTPEGQNTVMNTRWAAALTHSRTSRGLYGTIKMLTFLYLGCLIAYRHSNPSSALGVPLVRVSVLLSAFTVALCLIRGIPVLVGGWKFLKKTASF